MKKRTLITAANQAKAYQLLYLIGETREVIFADSSQQNLLIPSENSASYAHELLTLCLNHQIEELIPLKEKEINALAEAKILFAEYGIDILTPDLLQMKLLKSIENIHTVKKTSVKDFNEFSKTLLELGYPEKSICFGDSERKGELILIDDSKKYQPNIWQTITAMPFISTGKLLNTGNFEPIDIYVLDEPEIKPLDVFYDGSLFKILQKTDEVLASIVKNLLDENQLKGFYRIETSGNKIIRIKPNVVLC